MSNAASPDSPLDTAVAIAAFKLDSRLVNCRATAVLYSDRLLVRLEIAVALAPVTANNPVASSPSVAGFPTLVSKKFCIASMSSPATSNERRMPKPLSPTLPITFSMSASPSSISLNSPVAP